MIKQSPEGSLDGARELMIDCEAEANARYVNQPSPWVDPAAHQSITHPSPQPSGGVVPVVVGGPGEKET